MAVTHKIRFVEADCRHCRRNFSIPLLGDQSYGHFVLHGEKGGVFGEYEAVLCPYWEDISLRLLKIIKQSEFSRSQIARFQEVVANCADKIGGQKLQMNPICPFCRSCSLDYGDSKPRGFHEIPIVTFIEYQSLSESAKTHQLNELWNSLASNP